MSKVTKGYITRYVPPMPSPFGGPVRTLAVAFGDTHTMDEMRAFVEEHAPDPQKLQVGDRITTRLEIDYGTTQYLVGQPEKKP